MLVPRFWAEARARSRQQRPRVTVYRFGWSDESEAAAKEHAQTRADEALQRMLAGEELETRERRVPYNGAYGLPIREEILESHLDGDAVITRNSYGAHCLNVTDVLFGDVDFDRLSRTHQTLGCLFGLVGFLAGMAASIAMDLWLIVAVIIGLLGSGVGTWLYGSLVRFADLARGGRAIASVRRVERFVRRHPEWRVRVYGTPNGLRLLAMHRTFDPQEDLAEIEEFFRAVDADPIYRRMCRLQRCFRARLTPKPWRIGISEHMRPRPGVWPVSEDKMPLRTAWVDRYEAQSEGFAACMLLEVLGSDRIDPRAAQVRDLHDERARATSELPLA